MSSNGEVGKVVDFETLNSTEQSLILDAIKGRKMSYSPYSKFAVGAAVLCDDGTIFTGCNVENAAFGMCICAERTALVKAVSEGHRKFKAVAVIGQQDNSFTTPCGACRQFIVEFGTDITVYVTRPTLGNVLVTTILELLARPFVELQTPNC